MQLLFLTGQNCSNRRRVGLFPVARRSAQVWFSTAISFRSFSSSISRVRRIPRRMPTIPPSRLSPSMRRPSLVARVQFPITGHRLFVLPTSLLLANPPSLHRQTAEQRVREGLNDRSRFVRYCERSRGIRDFLLKRSLHRPPRATLVYGRSQRSSARRHDFPKEHQM